MAVKNYHEVQQELFGKLKQYLEEQGIDTARHFKCINPEHEDKSPSCSLLPNGLVFHCFGCLPGEQLIKTPKGLVPIQDLKIKDPVYLVDGTVGTVLNWIPRINNQHAMISFQLGTIHNDDLRFTVNHEMLVVKNLPDNVPYLKRRNNDSFRFFSKLKGRKLTSKYKDKLQLQNIRADQVTPDRDYFVLPVVNQYVQDIDIKTESFLKSYTSGPKTTRVTSIPVTESSMWLYGLYCAEGNTYRGGINLTLNISEQSLAIKAKEILEKFSPSKVILDYQVTKNTIAIRTSSTDLENIFAGLFGVLAENKTCPDSFLHYPLSLQKAFLQGIQDGDGCKRTGKITTISRSLAAVVQQIFINLKQPFSFSRRESYVDKLGLKHAESFHISPLKRESRNIFFDKINGKDFCFFRVKSTSFSKPLETVFDITVQGPTSFATNTFLCQHYAVHNCGTSGNIFHATHYLENKPMIGLEFLEDNLKYLANKYGLEVESDQLTEEQLYELDTYKAYRTAAELIRYNKANGKFQEALDNRGWKRDLCQEYGVGCVTDYKEFRERMKKFGFQAKFLDDVDLSREEIFGNDRLIFTIRDHYGRPVGFASRNLSYNGEKENGAKYCNQKHTGIKCNIYQKSTRLFGLDLVLKNKKKKSNPPVYVFEGYSDVVTAAHYGIPNTVALGGTAFTPEQVHLLKEHGFYDVILCLDGDQAGQERTAALLDTSLSGHKDLKVSIIIIPEGLDPDDFLRKYGAEQFKKLRKWSAFEWRLAQFASDANDEVVCASMIPLIVNEPSYIAQEKMCETLAKHTSMSIKTIQSELQRLQNMREAEKSREKQNIVDRMVRTIQREPERTEFAIQEAQDTLYEIARKYDEDAFSEDTCLARLKVQKQYEEAKDGSFTGYILGEGFKLMEQALCGDWRKDVWLVWGGKPNSGKTSFLCRLAYAIAKHEVENDALVIYHTIDDTAQQVIPKFVCIADGSRQLTINEVLDPNYYTRNGGNSDLTERREAGYNTIEKMIKGGRLIVKDANDGNSIAFADRLIRYYKNKYPKRNLVYILDNFHKLHDFEQMGGDERVRFKKISNVMKGLATRHHIAVLSTVEYRKTDHGKKATNEDISETGQIEYDASLIAHIFNEVHDLGEEKATSIHLMETKTGIKILPRLEVLISKNKISNFKNRLFFNFWPENSDCSEVEMKVAIKESKQLGEQKGQAVEAERQRFNEIFEELVVQNGGKAGKAYYRFMEEFNHAPPFAWTTEECEAHNIELPKGKA